MDTSAQAQESIERSGRAENLRMTVWNALRCGPMTADETAAAIGEDVLAIRPRFSELRKLDLIRDTGERRANKSGKKAAVWEAVV